MKLNREILRLALPSILANVTVPLVGMVDLAVVGHLGGDLGFGTAALLGGIAIGTMIFDLLYWNFGFLRSGTGGLTAQAFGRGDREESSMILLRSLALAAGAGIILIALQWVIVQVAFVIADCSPEVKELASRYFYIRIWAAPATLSLFALRGWFVGMQDTVSSMATDLTVNIVNILLSLGLGFGYAGLPRMGFAGVAAGTLIAQWTGVLFAAVLIWRKYPWAPAMFRPREAFRTSLRPFFEMNRDLFLRSLGLIAVYVGFTAISARFGDMMLGVGAIMMKLLMIFSYFIDGFAYAGEALTGRFIGAGSDEGVRSTVRATFGWGAGVALLFVAVYWIGGTPLFSLMTSDPAVVEAGKAFLPWLLLMPLIGCPAFVWDGIFIGATATPDLRRGTLLCAAGFFAVWFIGKAIAGASCPETTAIHILMGAYFAHLAVRTVYFTVRSRGILPVK